MGEAAERQASLRVSGRDWTKPVSTGAQSDTISARNNLLDAGFFKGTWHEFL